MQHVVVRKSPNSRTKPEKWANKWRIGDSEHFVESPPNNKQASDVRQKGNISPGAMEETLFVICPGSAPPNVDAINRFACGNFC